MITINIENLWVDSIKFGDIRERQTVFVPFSYVDSSGSVTPTKVQWSLTDIEGNILNSRVFTGLSVNSLEIPLDHDDTDVRTHKQHRILINIASVFNTTAGEIQINSVIRADIKLSSAVFPDLIDDKTKTILDTDVIPDDTIISDDTIMGG